MPRSLLALTRLATVLGAVVALAPANAAAGSLTVGRFRGGALDDLAMVGEDAPGIRLYFNDGQGGLRPGPVLPTAEQPCAVAAGRFTRSGHVDLAVSTCGFRVHEVEIFLGDGKGGFQPAPGSPYPVGNNPHALAVGRFTGSGVDDLAVTNCSDGNVTVLLGDGAGRFHEAPGSPFAVGDLPSNIVAGRFLGGAHQDLALVADQRVKLFRGDGRGGFREAEATLAIPVEGRPFSPLFVHATALAAIDPEHTGRDGLAVALGDGNAVLVLLNQGDARFVPAPGAPHAVKGLYASALAVGPLTGPGHVDVVVASQDSSSVSVLLDQGGGRFALAEGSPYRLAEQFGNIPALALGRFTSPESADVAYTWRGRHDALVLRSEGRAAFLRAGGSGPMRRLRVPEGWTEVSGKAPPGAEPIGTWVRLAADGVPTMLFEYRSAVAESFEVHARSVFAAFERPGSALVSREDVAACGARGLRFRAVSGQEFPAPPLLFSGVVMQLDGFFYVAYHVTPQGTPPPEDLEGILGSLCADASSPPRAPAPPTEGRAPAEGDQSAPQAHPRPAVAPHPG